MNTPRPKKNHPQYIDSLADVLVGDTVVMWITKPSGGRVLERAEVLDMDTEYGILTNKGWLNGNDILDSP